MSIFPFFYEKFGTTNFLCSHRYTPKSKLSSCEQMSPTTTYHKFYSRLLRIRFLPTLNTPRNFQSSHLHSSRNFYPANSIHTLIRPISLISINLPSSTAVVRGSISTIAGVSTMTSGGGNGGDSVTFRLTPTSSLKIQKGDITQWSVDGSSDAIVSIKYLCPPLYNMHLNLAELVLV